MTDRAPHQDLLADAFGRVAELVDRIVDGAPDAADPDALTFRPDDHANSVAWLVWHLTRVQDDHVAEAAGTEQVWRADGFVGRFDLSLDADDTGYEHSPDDVAAVRVSAGLLGDYHAAVHRATRSYLDRIDADELARVVDDRYDPPVTVAARLVSVLADCLQHAGQASYVQGLAERARGRAG